MTIKRTAWIVLGLLAATVAFAPLPARSVSSQTRTFKLDARQFAYSPSELKVNAGDTVTIQLVSADVVHGLYVDDYDVSVSADPGQSATITFVADKPGSFRFRCHVTCGAMHPFMIGKLTVGAKDWLYRSFGLAFLALFALILVRPAKQARTT